MIRLSPHRLLVAAAMAGILSANAQEPLTALPDGMIWWAGMYGSLIGRLDPATGRMTEWKLDPQTEQFQSWPIPSGVGIIRNMRATHDGNLVIHQSSTNTVGLVLIDHESAWMPGSYRP